MKNSFVRILVLVNLVSLLFISACNISEKTDERQSGVTVKIETPPADPIVHALQVLGLESADLIRPLHAAVGYHLVARNPLIDHIAQSPFYLHGWADDTSNRLQLAAQNGLFDVLSFIIRTFNGGVAYEQGEEIKALDGGGLQEAYINLCRRFHAAPDQNSLKAIKQVGFSEAFDRQMGELLSALTEAAILARSAIADLSPEEIYFLSSRPEGYFFPKGIHFNFLTAATHIPDEVLPITRKIDFVSLFRAGLVMAKAVDRFSGYLVGYEDHNRSAHFFADGSRRTGVVLDLESPLGRLVVFGQDNNSIVGHGALVIDLGGNDRYSGAIAVGSREPARIALALDIDGDDIYDRGDRRFGLGFGCLSVGMLVDISGNDKYLAGDMSQGSGMYGIGMLMDLSGRDYYRMGLMGQGFGLFGIGLLLDVAGNDRYILNGMGQGTGSTMGFGSLVDGQGNDKFLADRNQSRGILVPDHWSHVQGAGLSIRSPDWHNQFSYYGGIGFLSDGGGDDFYFASNGNCMGSSYFMSVGALVDHGGNDKYMPQNGYGLGFAVHLSNGILIDRKGNDIYFGKKRTGGVGSDRSIAVLADYEGDDTYGPSEEYARGLIGAVADAAGESRRDAGGKEIIYHELAENSYASALKPQALGMLLDYSGSDHYFANPAETAESLGGVIPPLEPHNWSHAMLLDLGGNDFYYKDRRQNNHYFKYHNHGICYDTEYLDTAGVGKKMLPVYKSRLLSVEKLPALSKNSRLIDNWLDLMHPDLLVRYAASGKIIRQGTAAIPDLINLLSVLEDIERNRDLIEILDAVILKGQLKQDNTKSLETLLHAPDPFVRIFAAKTLGDLRVNNALAALTAALSEENETVRVQIIRAVGRIGTPQALEVLVSLAANDASSKCRREAVRFLGILARNMSSDDAVSHVKVKKALLKAIQEEDEAVRSFAAFGLQCCANDPAVRKVLTKALQDESVYVTRMAAKALILNGIKKGIPALIDTLKFRSIDTFEHYDNEIAKDLAYYTGIDFPEKQRYAYSTWHAWWQQFGRSVDLNHNLEIMRTIESAFEAPSTDEGIAIFERLIEENPQNIVVRKRYLRFCNEWINFRLLTSQTITPQILKKCLLLQAKITELEPERAAGWDRLAYFLARLSRYQDAIAALESAIALQPENKDFQKTLLNYRQSITTK